MGLVVKIRRREGVLIEKKLLLFLGYEDHLAYFTWRDRIVQVVPNDQLLVTPQLSMSVLHGKTNYVVTDFEGEGEIRRVILLPTPRVVGGPGDARLPSSLSDEQDGSVV